MIGKTGGKRRNITDEDDDDESDDEEEDDEDEDMAEAEEESESEEEEEVPSVRTLCLPVVCVSPAAFLATQFICCDCLYALKSLCRVSHEALCRIQRPDLCCFFHESPLQKKGKGAKGKPAAPAAKAASDEEESDSDDGEGMDDDAMIRMARFAPLSANEPPANQPSIVALCSFQEARPSRAEKHSRLRDSAAPVRIPARASAD